MNRVPESTESRANRSSLPSVLQKDFVFIIGSDRSGTTWLQSMLGAHPHVATTVQMTLFHHYVPAWVQSWELECGYIDDPNQWDMGLPVVWTEEEFIGFLREFIAKVYSCVGSENPAVTHILDKHPAYREHVDEIEMLIPHARFIHVLRDGRDVALSLCAAKEGLGWGFSSISDAVINWKQFVESGQQAAKFGDRYLEVSYENMTDDGESVLRSVFEFCGLPADEVSIDEIVQNCSFDKMKSSLSSPDPNRSAPAGHYRRGIAGAWKDELSPMQRYLIDFYAGDMLRQLGYADSRWWYQSQLQRFSAPLMAHSLRVLRRIGRMWRWLRSC